jgi:TetR/AcrR family transcriptional regulator, regulator of cefoperazone and chloramphenicol sensitivity
MARDASETRELLLRTAQRLFARDGIYQVPLKRVVEAAGQRNASALHYHFGSRDGLLREIILRNDAGIEHERRDVLEELAVAGRLGDLRALVEALVVPFSRELATPEGREYLEIVSQLSTMFGLWDVEMPDGPTEAQRTFRHIEACLADLPAAMRHERVTVFLGLVTEALATRARLLDGGSMPPLDDVAFVTNLVDMSVGALCAPATMPTADGT